MKKYLFSFLFLCSFSVFCQENEPSLFFQRAKLSLDVIKTSIKTVPSDFSYMGKNVAENWKNTALYTGLVGGLILVDKPVTQFYQEEIETRINYTLPNLAINNNTFPWISGHDVYMTYAMSGIYVGSLFTGYEKGQYAAINGFKALTYSILISHVVLKTIFGRARPYSSLKNKTADFENPTDNPFNFFNSREGVYIMSGPHGTSLPSLHATAFFAMAKVFQMEFDNYWIPYSFMAAVFLADIEDHRHWVSDMVAGGIIGTVIGRSIVRSSWRARGILPTKKNAISLQWIPRISTKYNGLQVVATF